MCKIKYSIIYAMIRPQIGQRISIGIIMFDNDGVDIRYSDRKLEALKILYSESEYNFISEVVKSMHKDSKIKSIGEVEYLSRYSNNLINFSNVATIDLESTTKNKEWLYSSYVSAH